MPKEKKSKYSDYLKRVPKIINDDETKKSYQVNEHLGTVSSKNTILFMKIDFK